MGRSESPEDRSRSRRDGREHKRHEKEKRHKHRSRSRSRDRQKRERGGSGDERDHKRSKRDEPRREDVAPRRPTPEVPATLDAARAAALQGHDAEEGRRLQREAEQRELEDEMDKRRKRIEAWQEQRRKLAEQQEEEERAAAEAAAEAAQQKAWTLEGESSEEDEEDGNPAAAAAGAEHGAAANGAALAPPPRRQEDDEEEEDPLDAFMAANAIPAVPSARQQPAAAAAAEEEEEIDPLDAFMATNVVPEVAKPKPPPQQPAAAEVPAAGTAAAGSGGGAEPMQVEQPAAAPAPAAAAAGPPAANGEAEATSKPAVRRRSRLTRYDSDSSDEGGGNSSSEEESEEEDDAEWMRKLQAGKLTKGDKLQAVDHAEIVYPPFRRNFYIEVPELARMTPDEVEEYRKLLDAIKVRGKNVPKPVKNWNQCGLSSRVLDVLRKGGFDKPLPIQAQALPVIMSGRDCIGIAKTGSGKTLAFVLPMLRHIKDQPPLQQGDGPVALCMAPTRELVTQISKEVKRFARAVALNCTTVYGGSGVANQITELKRGTEIVVCTPGRMIDILVTSGGKITNLRRVTYLVLDEADRMFDMGFEPQIMRIVQNTRPDRQTVMFSATFPRQVEVLARQVLQSPVEIQVGGRSVVNKDITQYVEIRPEEDRFLRLLEVLGEWYERGKLLIFVGSQERCDNLFRDLLRAGYPCLSLHGGKDQADRESTISDFKSNVCNILVATSVAARGLDVRDLVLVVNYDAPNHHEDYVHRVGRTGRAGQKGTAITFIGPEEEQYSPDLVKALRESGVPVPQDLKAMADGFEAKRKAGTVKAHGSGFGGTGFKFDASEAKQVKDQKKAAAKEFGIVEESESDEEGDDGSIREVGAAAAAAAAGQPGAPAGPIPSSAFASVPGTAALPAAPIAAMSIGPVSAEQIAAAAAARQGGAPAPPAEGQQPQQGLTEEQIASMPPEVQARVRAAQALAAKLAGSGLGAAPAAPPPQQMALVMGTMPVSAAAIAAGMAFQPQQPAAALGQQPMSAAAPQPPAINAVLAAAQAFAAKHVAPQMQQQAMPQLQQQPQMMQQPGQPTPASMYMQQQALLAAQMQQQQQQQAAMAARMQQQQQQQQAGMAGMHPVLPANLAAMMMPPPGTPTAAAAAGAAAGTAGAAKDAPKHYEAELEINDFPQSARWKVTHRDTIRDIGDLGAALYVKGRYYKTGSVPGPGEERKLYLIIQGPTEQVVKRAKAEIKRVIEESTEKAMRRDTPAAGRYSIV